MFVKIGHAKAQWKADDSQVTARTTRDPSFIPRALFVCWFAGFVTCFHFDGFLERILWCAFGVQHHNLLVHLWSESQGWEWGMQASAALPLTKPLWISAFLPHDSGDPSPSECRTHNWWTIQTLRGGHSQTMRNQNQQTSSWASHFLSGNWEEPLKVPMELNPIYYRSKLDHEKHIPLLSIHPCLEGSLSKWNSCTWRL